MGKEGLRVTWGGFRGDRGPSDPRLSTCGLSPSTTPSRQTPHDQNYERQRDAEQQYAEAEPHRR